MVLKKLLLTTIIIVSALYSETNAQKQIVFEGITIPRTMQFENKTLQLNGAGSRSKMWVEVYIQALYLSVLSPNPEEIINDDSAMSIRIHITSALVSSGKLTRALNSGFERSAGINYHILKPKIDLLKSYLKEDITRNDVFELTYNPADKSIWVVKNKILQGKVEGFDFKKVFFGIWLGENPIDQDLKKSLLGN